MLAQALTLALLVAPAAQSAPPRYRVIVLEPLSGTYATAEGISDTGAVVRSVLQPSAVATAARWDEHGALTVLGREQTSAASIALDVNAAGVIVGSSSAPYGLPIVWTLPDGGFPLTDLQPTWAIAVNSNNDILCLFDAGGPFAGLLFQRDGNQFLIPGVVHGLSDDGRVAGTYVSAYRWSVAGGFEALPAPAGYDYASSFGMGPDGAVVGGASNPTESRAVVWGQDGQPVLLPYSAGLVCNDAIGEDANASGWIVGRQIGYELGGDPHAERAYATLWVGGSAYT